MMQRNMIENTTMLSTSEMPMTMAMGMSVTAKQLAPVAARLLPDVLHVEAVAQAHAP